MPWLEPYPDRLLAEAAPAEDEPDAAVVGRRRRSSLAFLAVLQLLPPRQRAALVLRDVLDWPAAEVAELLELSVPAVNSALQRARATLRTALPVDRREHWSAERRAAVDEEVLARYIAAYEAADVDTTLALLADDIRVTMPPAPYLFEGREAVLGLAYRARTTGEWRLVPTRANAQPAAACYLRSPGEASSGRTRSTCSTWPTTGPSARSRLSGSSTSTRSACRPCCHDRRPRRRAVPAPRPRLAGPA